MTITQLRRADGRLLRPSPSSNDPIPAAFLDLVNVGVLASAREPFDPMEKAFHELRRRSAPEAEPADGGALEFVSAYGLRPDLLAVTQVWKRTSGGSKLQIASKGAPEAIAEPLPSRWRGP